jgi:hypothetical protein
MVKILRKVFTYRNGERVNTFMVHDDILIVSTRYSLKMWNIPDKRITKDIRTDATFMSLLVYDQKYIFLSKNGIYSFFDNRFIKLSPLDTFSFPLVVEDHLLFFNEANIFFYKTGEYVNTSREGICTSAVSSEKTVYLSYESGKVYSISKEDLLRKDIKLLLLFDFKEPVSSIDICGDTLLISLFSGRILLNSHVCKSLKLEKDVRKALLYEDRIFVLLDKLYLMVLDRNLNVLVYESYEDEICDVRIFRNSIFISLGDGRIIEYL